MKRGYTWAVLVWNLLTWVVVFIAGRPMKKEYYINYVFAPFNRHWLIVFGLNILYYVILWEDTWVIVLRYLLVGNDSLFHTHLVYTPYS